MAPNLLSRRRLLALGSAAATAAAVAACPGAPVDAGPPPSLRTPGEVLHRLLAGNRRFARGSALQPRRSPAARHAVAAQQRPCAVVLGCIDSRVAPELVFDQGIGDLLVVRSAGHVPDEVVLGSVEYGVADLGVPLVVVLGHTRCGAVTLAVEALGGPRPDGRLGRVADAIRPAAARAPGDGDERVAAAVVENVRLVAEQVRSSPVIGPRLTSGGLHVVGACYDLERGLVQVV